MLSFRGHTLGGEVGATTSTAWPATAPAATAPWANTPVSMC